MGLITKVKVSHLNNLTEARFYAGAQVEWLEFCFEEDHPKFVDPVKAYDILEWVQGPTPTGAFGDLPGAKIREIIEALQLKAVTLTLKDNKALIRSLDLPVIGRLMVDDTFTRQELVAQLENWHGLVSHFQINFREAELSQKDREKLGLDDKNLAAVCNDHPLLLDMTWEKEQMMTVIKEVQPAGINIPAAGEEATGMKAFEGVADLIESLEAKA